MLSFIEKGGLKSVLATDIIQVIMMFAGLLLVIFRVIISNYNWNFIEINYLWAPDSYTGGTKFRAIVDIFVICMKRQTSHGSFTVLRIGSLILSKGFLFGWWY